MFALLSPSDWAAVVVAVASVVAAVATVVYVKLTRKLWEATNATVELTRQMMERSEEPLCAVSALSASFNAGTLCLDFELKNAGSSPPPRRLPRNELEGL